ncbi:MAG: hypothetical protein ACHQ4J_07965 [Candidatus Binatia bacterium]
MTNTIIALVFINVLLGLAFVLIDARQRVQSLPPLEYYKDLLSTTYPQYSAGEVVQLLAETWSRPLACAAFTHFRERPYQGKFVNVRPPGFRVIKDQAPWPPDHAAYNIFVFGGSTAFGYNVADNETIASSLQEQLRRGGWNVAVYNFGQAYYFSSLELALFEQLLREGTLPDAAIFIDGLNESYHWDGQPIGMEICGKEMAPPEGRHWELPMVRLADVVATRLTRASTPGTPSLDVPPPDDAKVCDGVLDRWFANRAMIEATAAAYGVEALFVWQPVPTYEYDLAYHPYVQRNPESFDKHLRSKYCYATMARRLEGQKKDDDLLDLAHMQREVHERLYVDMVHYTPKFSAQIAGAIADRLLERRRVSTRAATGAQGGGEPGGHAP